MRVNLRVSLEPSREGRVTSRVIAPSHSLPILRDPQTQKEWRRRQCKRLRALLAQQRTLLPIMSRPEAIRGTPVGGAGSFGMPGDPPEGMPHANNCRRLAKIAPTSLLRLLLGSGLGTRPQCNQLHRLSNGSCPTSGFRLRNSNSSDELTFLWRCVGGGTWLRVGNQLAPRLKTARRS